MPLENTEKEYNNIGLSSKTNTNIETIDTDFTKINQDKNDLSTATGKLFEYKDNQKSFGTMSDIINPTNSTTNQQYQNNQIKMQQPKEQTKSQNFDDFNKQFDDNNQMSMQDFSTFNTQKNKIPTFGNMPNFEDYELKENDIIKDNQKYNTFGKSLKGLWDKKYTIYNDSIDGVKGVVSGINHINNIDLQKYPEALPFVLKTKISQFDVNYGFPKNNSLNTLNSIKYLHPDFIINGVLNNYNKINNYYNNLQWDKIEKE